ncbi:hypothetical protein E4U46_000781 [Claviceps purpurea]|nr:hypothetical protein E4U46_000781 [Claviceps purpurea]
MSRESGHGDEREHGSLSSNFRAIYCSPREISLNIVTDIRPEYVLYTKKPDFPFHGTARPFYLECSQSAFADQVVGTYQHFQFFNFRLLDITYPHPYTMNLFHILNPPGEFPRQMPPTIDIQRHVTQGSISPHAGLESAQSQSGIPPGNEQLAPITIPLAQLPTDPSQTGPLEELEYSVLSALPGVDIPLETKSGTKAAQERRNRNASSSRLYRDNRRAIVKAEAINKKQKEMAERIKTLEEESRQKDERLRQDEERIRQDEERIRQDEETIRQERERSRQAEAENERLRRENEALRQSK